MNIPITGTPIQDLQRREEYNNHYNRAMDPTDIEDLANDISDKISIDNLSKVHELMEADSPKKGYLAIIPEILREPFLLLAIYLILSLQPVKEFIGKYIKYINPTSEGNVPFSGIFIYGLILTILFILIKRLLL